jgi:hypothetical protein
VRQSGDRRHKMGTIGSSVQNDGLGDEYADWGDILNE